MHTWKQAWPPSVVRSHSQRYPSAVGQFGACVGSHASREQTPTSKPLITQREQVEDPRVQLDPSGWLQTPSVATSPSLLQLSVSHSASARQGSPIARGLPQVCVSRKHVPPAHSKSASQVAPSSRGTTQPRPSMQVPPPKGAQPQTSQKLTSLWLEQAW